MRQSKLVTTTRKEISKEEASINAQLLTRGGYVERLMAGVYSYLPLGVRVLTKIENIIREEMSAIGSEEVLMPAIQPKEIWETTGRWNSVDVMFKLKGAGDRDLCLGPSHEEVVTPLVGCFINSYRTLPRSVFQLQTKFRNEARAKSGILRGREFRMKDMYSFHASVADLDAYYDLTTTAYTNVFKRVGLGDRTYKTYAGGGIFTKYSHEFQTVTPFGEDIIHVCKSCAVAINREIIEDLAGKCPVCGLTNLVEEKAIEVGNIFKLMTRFSDACGLSYQDDQGKPQQIFMGCYGIGSSRLMGAVVEILHDEKGIIWPEVIAPFKLHLIALTRTGEEVAKADSLYEALRKRNVEVLYDDRGSVGAGEKFADSDLIGIPTRVIMSARTIAQNAVEVKSRNKKDGTNIGLDEFLTSVSS